MMRVFGLITAISICALLIGCGKPKVDKDKEYARSIIYAVYAGSFTPVAKSMVQQMQVTPDSTVQAQGEALRKQFGNVKDIALKIEGEVNGFNQSTWTVTAERGTFDMRLVFMRDGRLAAVWFDVKKTP